MLGTLVALLSRHSSSGPPASRQLILRDKQVYCVPWCLQLGGFPGKSFSISALSTPSPCSQHTLLLSCSLLFFSLFFPPFSSLFQQGLAFLSTHSAQALCCTVERDQKPATYPPRGAPGLGFPLCTLVMQSLAKSTVTVHCVFFKAFLHTSSKSDAWVFSTEILQ